MVPTKNHHDLCQWFLSRNSGTSESCKKLWEMGRRLVKEQDYQGRSRLENKLTSYLHYHGVGLWFIAADKLVGSKGNLTCVDEKVGHKTIR